MARGQACSSCSISLIASHRIASRLRVLVLVPLSFTFVASPLLTRSQPFVKAVAASQGQHPLLLSDMIPLYRKLASDDQDSVRLLTIPDLIALAQNLSPEEVKSNLLDSLRASVTDKSWRVRYMVANEFVGLAESVGEAIIREELVGAFVGLLKDNEAEVRTAAASQIPGERGGPDPSRSRDSCRNPCRNPWALSHRLTSRRDFTGPGP